MVRSLYYLYLLGSFQIEYIDPVDGLAKSIRLPRRKSKVLLAYLAMYPQSHSRETLAALLWGDYSDVRAHASLRTCLSVLRKRFGNNILRTEGETIQLNPDFGLGVDVYEFELAADKSRVVDIHTLRTAITLYRGDFLSGLYDDWILSERERLHLLYVKTLLNLTEQLRARSEYEQAIEMAQKVLETEPANERAYQHLMFCYMASGNPPAALEQYRRAARILQDDLGVEPMPETTALYLWIKQTPSASPSLAARITNLPIPLTSFIGRKQEMREIKNLLSSSRLLTLTGAGGSGKTRLAIQVATDLIDHFKDGVWWVDLSSLIDQSLLPQSIAKSLGVREVANQSLIETLADHLNSKQMLLVVDNCEHLILACAHLFNNLLNQCPSLQMLATSREPLGISGEAIWPIPSLSVPEQETMALIDFLLSFESIHLFIERARAVKPDFAVTNQNVLAIIQICQRLDGIPLAIELAAARIKHLVVEEIAARLDDRFTLLNQGSRAALPRHQTLRAAIDWNYSLLKKEERILFRRLSVFAGGFTLGAVEAICAGQDIIQTEVLELLSHLVDKSLVVAQQKGATRYHMLETMREYTREKLEDAGEVEQVRNHHLNFYLSLAEEGESKLRSSMMKEWLVWLDTEHDNLRVALSWSQKQVQQIEKGLRLAGALFWFWHFRNYLAEGRGWLERILNIDAQNPRRVNSQSGPEYANGRAKALYGAAAMAWSQGDLALGDTRIKECLAMGSELKDKRILGYALSGQGLLSLFQGDLSKAFSLHEEAVVLMRKLDDKWGLAMCLGALGYVANRKGDYETAQAVCKESEAIFREIGELFGLSISLRELGRAEYSLGNPLIALPLLEEAVVIGREWGDEWHLADALNGLADVTWNQGNHLRAKLLLIESLVFWQKIGNILGVTLSLRRLARLALSLDRPQLAALLFGAAQSLSEMTGLRLSPAEQMEYENDIATTRAQLDGHTFAGAWAVGQKMTQQQAVEYVLSVMSGPTTS